MKTEGLFRIQGNIKRLGNVQVCPFTFSLSIVFYLILLQRIYCGLTPIPRECSVHDICSLIKRFFQEITTPIFSDAQAQLVKFAETLDEERLLLDAIFNAIDRLPTPHISTIAFLMRYLKKVGFSFHTFAFLKVFFLFSSYVFIPYL